MDTQNDNTVPLQLFTLDQQKDIKKRGAPRKIKTATDLWTRFIEYIEWNKEQTDYYKSDFIKAGQLAGTIIDVPLVPMLQIESFCSYIGLTDETLLNYAKRPGNDDLFGIVTRIKAEILNDQVKRASLDLVNPNIVAMINNMKQRQDITTDGNEIGMVNVSFISSKIPDTQ